MKIAVDGFGGDYAPEQVVAGCLQAASEDRIPILLTGDQAVLAPLIAGRPGSELIEIVHASEQIGMDEAPVEAVRAKKDASLTVAARLVKDKEAAGLVSAGNTGACMAAALFIIGRIKGIERPAITSLMPTVKGICLMVDVGANVDCRPSHLAQFAQMGAIYAQRVLGRPNPRVGLLNIGEEPSKGNDAAQKAYQLLSCADINFIGNIEGRDIPGGEADVVVCDGFVGNIVLKFAEGLGLGMFSMLKEELTASLPRKLAAAVLRPGLAKIKKKMDYAEYGGAPLLGVKGTVIIAHGSSNAKAIRNAIRVAKEAASNGVVDAIAQLMAGGISE
ncbi:MAG TPA: phosphate acyltransferase PlsX [Limnochordia bacterium]|nr:phosphate acyltransferase PlsX [Bacillota bacterium]HOB08428.1 phosphate acyltransferase PlsX [Limnochordia bacterium]NLH30272.1 phosphate acyltransferase PlsX [Bacillota bacterium]HPT92229.1 phosphate acyltransferase PlsX [Limnochordia bacterium]HPZ30877.1 phosphate acyltransferase PlsX [Limnochordia bacterium]